MAYFTKHDKYLEAQRLGQRTKFDLEMLEETGFVKGIENYSRYLTNREPGEQPATLLDYFPDDFLLFVDEVTRRFLRFAVCTMVIVRAKKFWLTMGFVCRARSITARSVLMSSINTYTKRFTFPPPQVTMSCLHPRACSADYSSYWAA